MSNVFPIGTTLAESRGDTDFEKVRELDLKVVAAINEATAEGLSYGLIIAVLQGHLYIVTKNMVEHGRL